MFSPSTMNLRPARLQTEGIQFGPLIDVVFAWIAEAVFKQTGLFRQCPNDAFACGKSLRLTLKNGVFESQWSVNPLPACCFKCVQNVRKNERIEHVEVNEQSMANITAEHIESELPIERGAIEKMWGQVVAIRPDRHFGILAKSVYVALAHVPVGRINGNVADAVAAFFEQSAETLALLHSVAFFQKGITEERRAIAKGGDNLFVFQKVEGKVGVAGLVVVIKPVRVRMVANQMARLIP